MQRKEKEAKLTYSQMVVLSPILMPKFCWHPKPLLKVKHRNGRTIPYLPIFLSYLVSFLTNRKVFDGVIQKLDTPRAQHNGAIILQIFQYCQHTEKSCMGHTRNNHFSMWKWHNINSRFSCILSIQTNGWM